MEQLVCPTCKRGVIFEVRKEVYEGPVWTEGDEIVELEGDSLEDNLERTDAYIDRYFCTASDDHVWYDWNALKQAVEGK